MYTSRQFLAPGFDDAPGWYVDSVNGNDANNGRSSSKPFQTISALTSISEGDSIYLAAGSSWREQLDISVDLVSIIKYGVGADPIIDASDIDANGSFAKTGGRINVYEISITPAWDVGNSWLNVWEGSTVLTRVADVATCDATPGSCYPSAASGTITLYVHATDSSDVTANGYVYTHTQRQYAINAGGADYILVDGVTCRKQLHDNGSGFFGRYARLSNCQFNWGHKHNVYIKDGARLIGTTCSGAYYGTSNGSMFIANENTPSGIGVLFQNCVAELSSYDSYISGFDAHNNVGGSFGVIRYVSCTMTNLGQGIGAPSDCSQVIVQDCVINDCFRGVLCSSDTEISGLTWDSGAIANVRAVAPIANGLTISAEDSSFTIGNTVDGGVIYLANSGTFSVDGCIFGADNHAAGITRAVYVDDAGANVNVSGCTYDSGWNQVYRLVTWNSFASDYNAFADGTESFYINPTTYNTVAAWVAGTGNDVHSTT